MTSVSEHYENHLAPIYLWMAGGMDAALARGQAEVDAVCARPPAGHLAVDLGAGFGMHAIPLAKLGYFVLAVDSSATLLKAMLGHSGALPIKIVQDDLLSFKKHLEGPAALIFCMGDTLTHLADRQAVEGLFADVAESLNDGGSFIVTFRDYSASLRGANRFIPVRNDTDRILTCFLEYEEDAVTVHDILHERGGPGWQQRVSAYRKLRLSVDWVTGALKSHGLEVQSDQGISGMVRVIANRPL